MLHIGDAIIGRWNNNTYVILDNLGYGGIGHIFKVKDNAGKILALKMSRDINSITREYSNMKALCKLECIPRVYEIDDYICDKYTYYFFIMDYVDGRNLKEIIRKQSLSLEFILKLGINLINIFECLYTIGYKYSDMKLENVMVERKNNKVFFIDFGGLVEKNSSFIEFTPTYNMISWGIGLDKGYEYYIIFGVSMMMISLLFKREYNPIVNNISDVINRVNLSNISISMKKLLVGGLDLKYCKLQDFRKSLKNELKRQNIVHLENSKRFDLIDAIFVGSIFLFITVLVTGINIFI